MTLKTFAKAALGKAGDFAVLAAVIIAAMVALRLLERLVWWLASSGISDAAVSILIVGSWLALALHFGFKKIAGKNASVIINAGTVKSVATENSSNLLITESGLKAKIAAAEAERGPK